MAPSLGSRRSCLEITDGDLVMIRTCFEIALECVEHLAALTGVGIFVLAVLVVVGAV